MYVCVYTIYLQSQKQEITVQIRNNKKRRRKAEEKKSPVVTFLSIATLVSSLHSCTDEAGAEITSSLAIITHVDHLDYFKCCCLIQWTAAL